MERIGNSGFRWGCTCSIYDFISPIYKGRSSRSENSSAWFGTFRLLVRQTNEAYLMREGLFVSEKTVEIKFCDINFLVKKGIYFDVSIDQQPIDVTESSIVIRPWQIFRVSFLNLLTLKFQSALQLSRSLWKTVPTGSISGILLLIVVMRRFD